MNGATGFLGNASFWDADQGTGTPDPVKFNAGTWTVDSGSVTTFTSKRVYPDVRLSPFWAGQELAFRATKAVVGSITQTTTGNMALAFSTPITLAKFQESVVPITMTVEATIPAPTTANANSVANQKIITVASTAGVEEGMFVTAPAIAGMSQANRKITTIVSDTSVTIVGDLTAQVDNNATVTYHRNTLSFSVADAAKIRVNDVVNSQTLTNSTVVGISASGQVELADAFTATIPVDRVLTFTGAMPNNGDAAVCKGVDSTATLSIDVPELVLYKTDQAAPDKINYTTYFTEEDTTNSGKVLQKIYQANADAVNCVMLCPTSNDRQTSDFNRLKDYRIRIDNKDLTDRNVTYLSALYFDDRHKALLNMGEQAMNLTGSRDYAFQSQTNAAVLARGSNNCVVMDVIMFPLPPSNRPKMIEVNIDKNNYSATDPATDLNDNGLILYTEIERSI